MTRAGQQGVGRPALLRPDAALLRRQPSPPVPETPGRGPWHGHVMVTPVSGVGRLLRQCASRRAGAPAPALHPAAGKSQRRPAFELPLIHCPPLQWLHPPGIVRFPGRRFDSQSQLRNFDPLPAIGPQIGRCGGAQMPRTVVRPGNAAAGRTQGRKTARAIPLAIAAGTGRLSPRRRQAHGPLFNRHSLARSRSG